MADSEPEQLFDVGRAWHAVHMLLNGCPWGGSGPAFDVVLGGTVLGDPSTYEPVRVLVPERVSAVAVLLTALPGDDLRGALHPPGVPPGRGLPGRVGPAGRAHELRAAGVRGGCATFYAEAAAAGDAVLVQLT